MQSPMERFCGVWPIVWRGSCLPPRRAERQSPRQMISGNLMTTELVIHSQTPCSAGHQQIERRQRLMNCWSTKALGRRVGSSTHCSQCPLEDRGEHMVVVLKAILKVMVGGSDTRVVVLAENSTPCFDKCTLSLLSLPRCSDWPAY